MIYVKTDTDFALFLSWNKRARTQHVFHRETNTLTRSHFSVFYSCRLSTPDLRKLNEKILPRKKIVLLALLDKCFMGFSCLNQKTTHLGQAKDFFPAVIYTLTNVKIILDAKVTY